MPESTSNSERTLKLIVEYDGTGLCGWQRQDNGPTVQQHLEKAIAAIACEPILIRGASRTDAGVHAEGQVATFSTSRTIAAFGFRQGINSYLPEQIRVRQVTDVPTTFNPRYDALGKHYRYTILNRDTESPLLRNRSWHRIAPLDLERMQTAASQLLGENDFSAFRASGCGAKTPHRRIDKISVTSDGEMVYVDVWGNAFLRNMVRIVAGTLVDVGMGRLPAEQMSAILHSRDRREAGQTAPAQGLCLIEVFYPEQAEQTKAVLSEPES